MSVLRNQCEVYGKRVKLTVEEMTTFTTSSQADSSTRTGPKRITGDANIDKRVAVELI